MNRPATSSVPSSSTRVVCIEFAAYMNNWAAGCGGACGEAAEAGLNGIHSNEFTDGFREHTHRRRTGTNLKWGLSKGARVMSHEALQRIHRQLRPLIV